MKDINRIGSEATSRGAIPIKMSPILLAPLFNTPEEGEHAQDRGTHGHAEIRDGSEHCEHVTHLV